MWQQLHCKIIMLHMHVYFVLYLLALSFFCTSALNASAHTMRRFSGLPFLSQICMMVVGRVCIQLQLELLKNTFSANCEGLNLRELLVVPRLLLLLM